MRKTLLGLLGLGALFTASDAMPTPTPPTEIQQPEKAVIPNRSKLPQPKMQVPSFEPDLTRYYSPDFRLSYHQSQISKRNPKRKVRVQARW